MYLNNVTAYFHEKLRFRDRFSKKISQYSCGRILNPSSHEVDCALTSFCDFNSSDKN